MANARDIRFSIYAAKVNFALVLVVLSTLLCFTVAFAQVTVNQAHSHGKRAAHGIKLSMGSKISSHRS
jgi:hypothetical protein